MSEEDPGRFDLPPAPDGLRERLEQGFAIAWSEPVMLPTYDPAPPVEFPVFLDRRVYQGSSGKVYPLPYIDSIATHASERSWQAIHLENAYVRLMVLPELGGRIHVGVDKTNGYDFFYRNNVIKPALVGLAGPWVSGGVEFNWPQHHRPGTHLPVEALVDRPWGDEVTVWCSDLDPLQRMKGMHGIRLRAAASVVEIIARLHNRTRQRQSFLWWANAAVHVHDRYQSFFPPDVRYVADHARRAITAFPAADRPYYGVDYPARAHERADADRIDFYGNIPVPTSYMIVDSEGEFFGGYDHDAHAGVLHVADRRISPGKKQWTWGDAPFGHAWDAHLTDDDGPYVELMAGVYTDNQPDFAWLMPGETKVFSQFWYPFRQIGIPQLANVVAAVRLAQPDERTLEIAVAATRELPACSVRLSSGTGSPLAEWRADLGPGTPFEVRWEAPDSVPRAVTVVVSDAAGAPIISYTPTPGSDDTAPEPEPATIPPEPEQAGSADELFLTGVHLTQYRHPTRSPVPYWTEALRHDPGDSRVRLALAEASYRTGSYEAALGHVRIALSRLTRHNLNPLDGEAHYLLGLIQVRMGHDDDARRAFGKAAWDGKWAHAAHLEGGCLDARAGRWADALDSARQALRYDTDDLRARALVAVALRRLSRAEEADEHLRDTIHRIDPLDPLSAALLGRLDASDARTLYDVALDLEAMGEPASALDLLESAASGSPSAAGNVRPVALYTRARILDRLGDPVRADRERERARRAPRRWAFPAGLDAHDALVAAVAADDTDGIAHTLLASLLFDCGRRSEAARHWLRATELGVDDAVTHRNLAIAAFDELDDPDLALGEYERARRALPHDARLLYEQDQLLARTGASDAERLQRLDAERELVLRRSDLTTVLCGLLTSSGRAQEALAILEERMFQPWEGGEGRVLAAWDDARATMGLAPADPPVNLGEARPEATPPAALREDGSTDYFATSLPDVLLFQRPDGSDR